MVMMMYCNECDEWKTLDRWHLDSWGNWSESCTGCFRIGHAPKIKAPTIQEKNVLISGGIYIIKNLVDGKSTSYIGSTVQSFADRWKRHRHDLRHGVAHNIHLQNAWNKYGEQAFEFSVLEVVKGDYSTLVEREQFWFDVYQKKGPTYNKGEVTRSPRYGVYKVQSYPAFLNKETGEMIHKGNDLHALCNQRDLNYSSMRRVMQQKQYQHKHWLLADESLRPKKKKRKKRTQGKYAHPAFHNYKTGETIPASDDLYLICQQVGLKYQGMKNVCRGHQHHHHNWILEENKDTPLPIGVTDFAHASIKPYPSFYNLKTGEIIPSGTNLAKLCRERNLTTPCMFKVKWGTADRHKNWILLEKKEEVLGILERKKQLAEKRKKESGKSYRHSRIKGLGCYAQILSLKRNNLSNGKIAQFIHNQGEALDLKQRSLEQAVRRYFGKHPELLE